MSMIESKINNDIVVPPNVPKGIESFLMDKESVIATFSKPSYEPTLRGAVEGVLKHGQTPNRIVVSVFADTVGYGFKVDSFTNKQSFSQHGTGESIAAILHPFWQAGFRQVLIQTPTADLQVLRSKNRVTVRKLPPSKSRWPTNVAVEARNRILNIHEHGDLLFHLDITDINGNLRRGMGKKYRQLCHLLDRITSSAPVSRLQAGDRCKIVDAGCGKGYLSIALSYLLRTRNVIVSLLGFDTNAHVIQHCRNVASTLELEGAGFECISIEEASDAVDSRADAPTILLALHACDTATDDALHLAVKISADLIIAAPCCHHFVQEQLRKAQLPPLLAPFKKDGIVLERLGDLLTDVMRRDILRANGYDANLEEFISAEHTHKNVLLHAVKGSKKTLPHLRQEIDNLRALWGAAPRLYNLMYP